MLAFSPAFEQTFGLILIFFVLLPGIATGLIVFAIAQALGERSRNAEQRRARDGEGMTPL